MKTQIFLFTILFLTLLGCTQTPQGKNCGTDKECLKSAFTSCEQAYGKWVGKNGNIGIQILNNSSDSCKIIFLVMDSNLEISNKSINCSFSPSKNFSIVEDCNGELKTLLSN
ncbi:MAG: hypothetical protein AABX38_05995 [Candidatus Micrarchaeota archaeon]